MSVTIHDEVAVSDAISRLPLPDFVVRVEHRFGDDWLGEPAVFATIIVRDESAEESDFFAHVRRVEQAIQEAVRGSGSDRIAFFRLRTVSEQAELAAEEQG